MRLKNNWQKFSSASGRLGKEHGGVAMEYVLVSVFGLLAAIAAITFISQAVEAKFATVEQELGVDFDLDSMNPFSE